MYVLVCTRRLKVKYIPSTTISMYVQYLKFPKFFIFKFLVCLSASSSFLELGWLETWRVEGGRRLQISKTYFLKMAHSTTTIRRMATCSSLSTIVHSTCTCAAVRTDKNKMIDMINKSGSLGAVSYVYTILTPSNDWRFFLQYVRTYVH